MTKRGFTLAELLGVIIIMGLLALFIVPAIDKSIGNSEEKVYQAQIKKIENAAEDWAMEHMTKLPTTEGDYIFIYLGQLKMGGYIGDDVRDPRTGKIFPNDMQIKVTRKSNAYIFEVVEGSGTEGNNGYQPVITLNGDDTIDVALNGTYTELGATAMTIGGEDISSNIVISGDVDTTQEGTYYVKYNLTFNGENAEEVVRTVNVIYMPPVITLSPNGTDGYSKALSVDVSVTTVDSSPLGSLTYRLNGGTEQNVVNNTISLNTSDVHILEVTAVDSYGNASTVTSDPYYVDTTPPTITFEEGDAGITLFPYQAVSYDLQTGVSINDSGGDSDISWDDVVIRGELSAIPGTYTIEYIATDKVGNITTETRNIIVGSTAESCFTFSSSSGAISGYDTTCGTDVVIPSTINGYAVTSIKNNAFDNDGLTSVFIPSSVTSIGNYAFYRNPSLSYAVISEGVTSIGTYAFYNSNLTSLTIPDSVTSIGDYAFYYCDLTDVTIPDSVTSIGAWAFYHNELASISLPNTIVSLGYASFNNNKLSDSQAFIYARNSDGTIDNTKVISYGGATRDNVVIPSTVTSIGNYAFSNNQLTSVTIPDSVTSIEAFAFYNNQLSSFVLPNTIISLGKAIVNKNQLQDSQAYIYARNSDGTIDNTKLISYGGATRDNVVIPSTVTNIGDNALCNNELTSVTIPNTVTSIGTYAFSTNLLTSVTIPNSITSIANGAFYDNNLTSVTIPSSVTSIGNYAFYSNNSMESLTLSNNLTSIGSYAFCYADSLTSVTIPNSVTSIGTYAFYSSGLTSLTLSNSLTSIGSSAFRYNDLTSITIPSSVMSIGTYAFRNNLLEEVIIEGKSSSADFTSYPTSTPFGWASGYSDTNITWNG